MTLSAKLALARGDFCLDVELQFARGITALFGPSGCGKTTVLRCLAGLERVHGRVAVNETVWQDANQFVPPHRRGVGYVFQEANLLPHLDVRQNLAFAATRRPQAESQLTINEAAELLGVTALLARRTRGLSGGERQRVAIARALLTAPRVLLMDEPLAALDAASKRELLPYFARLHAHLEIPIVYVSHVFDEIAQIADRMVLLEGGRVQAQGTIQELATRFDLPLAHADAAETLIDAEVESYDAEFHLAYLATPIGRIALVRDDLTRGQRVRARIHARDVSIALDADTRSSILNSFRATIAEIAHDRPGSVLLRLDANGITLLARITDKSTQALQLAPGKTVYAQVKSIALAE